MWAGELLFALGVSTREEQFDFDPDSGFNANQDRPSVIQNIILPVTVEGSTDVTEIYGELAIPLVRDKKFVQSFELEPRLPPVGLQHGRQRRHVQAAGGLGRQRPRELPRRPAGREPRAERDGAVHAARRQRARQRQRLLCGSPSDTPS